MRPSVGRLLSRGVFTLLAFTLGLRGQDAAVVEPLTTTLHVRSQIVLLDAAIVDKKGHLVGTHLTAEDFTVTEDGKPQRLLSVDPPSLESNTAKTVFVLDELNAAPADKSYYLVCLEQFLRAQPETLSNPTEFMVLTQSALRIVQPPTRSRAELLSALAHLPPTDATLINLEYERFARTLDALELVGLQSLGDTNRTAVVWLGSGYGVDLDGLRITKLPQTERYIRFLTNTLLESRITLHVVFPPDFVTYQASHFASSNSAALTAADPYKGSFNLRSLSAQTGGSVYTSTNDLVAAMRTAVDLGRGSYKLVYRPQNTLIDGQFRSIRVTLRNPGLNVLTKSGYYAPEVQEANMPQEMQVFQMSEAARASLPFHGIPLRVTHIDRSPDAEIAEFTISAEGKDLPWRSEAGESLSELTVGGLGLSKDGRKVSSNFRNVSMMSRSQDPGVLAGTAVSFKLMLALPRNADRVRLVVSSRRDGKLGCVDVSRAEIDAASTADLFQVSGPAVR